jgi:hypothetical protein
VAFDHAGRLALPVLGLRTRLDDQRRFIVRHDGRPTGKADHASVLILEHCHLVCEVLGELSPIFLAMCSLDLRIQCHRIIQSFRYRAAADNAWRLDIGSVQKRAVAVNLNERPGSRSAETP